MPSLSVKSALNSISFAAAIVQNKFSVSKAYEKRARIGLLSRYSLRTGRLEGLAEFHAWIFKQVPACKPILQTSLREINVQNILNDLVDSSGFLCIFR